MKLVIRLFLFFVIGLMSLFIVTTTHGEKLVSSFTTLTPTPTYHLFPLFTIKPLPSPKNQKIDIPPAAFCLPVPVLMYHHIENLDQAKRENHAMLTVDPTIFETQIQYLLSQGYMGISAEELLFALIKKQILPQKSVVITLDDGYDDIYENAYPIAKKYGIKINLMIPTGLMENAGYLQWSQIESMMSSGVVSIYNHTWSHASLPDYSPDQILIEISTAQTQLEERFGNIPKILAYPYGNFNDQIVNTLKNGHYLGAFSTIQGSNSCDSYLFSLRRLRIGNSPLSSYGL